MASTIKTAFIYAGGAWVTRPMSPLSLDASVDCGDATNATLTNDDFDAMYDMNITPQRLCQLIDKLSLINGQITNQDAYATKFDIKQPRPIRWDARSRLLDEELSADELQAAMPMLNATPETPAFVKHAAGVLEEDLDEEDERRMFAEVGRLPVTDGKPESRIIIRWTRYDPLGPVYEEPYAPTVAVQGNDSASNVSSNGDSPSIVTPSDNAVSAAFVAKGRDRSASFALNSGSSNGQVPVVNKSCRVTTKEMISKIANELLENVSAIAQAGEARRRQARPSSPPRKTTNEDIRRSLPYIVDGYVRKGPKTPEQYFEMLRRGGRW